MEEARSSAKSEGTQFGYQIIVTDDIKHRYGQISTDEYPVLMAEFARQMLNQLDDLGNQLNLINKRIDTIDRRVDVQNDLVRAIRQWVGFFAFLTVLSIIVYAYIFFTTLNNPY